MPSAPTALPGDALSALMADPAKRSNAQKKLLTKSAAQVKTLVHELANETERTKLAESQRDLETTAASYPTPLPKGYIWYEEGPTAAASRVFRRGDPRNPAEEVNPGFPAVLVDAPPVAPARPNTRPVAACNSAPPADARRSPLTARVLVNRLWQHHFGDGIVATESDFGVMGALPTNQPLLDWLASELATGGWRMKRMHRLIVLSQTYQMASTGNVAAERIDPSGSLLWRFPPHRLEAEALRDTVLAVSGQLNLEARGPGVYPKISREVLETQSRPATAGAFRQHPRRHGGACTCF